MTPAVILPVYNEAATLEKVLGKIAAQGRPDVVVVDDGSDDATPSILERLKVKAVIRHPRNEGYGRSLMDGFAFVQEQGYRDCVTMDADDQHEPGRIPEFLDRLKDADVVSGSRYLNPLAPGDAPPPDRLQINRILTTRLRALTGYPLTDSFCGFKSYRVEALRKLDLDEAGYAFPVQFWIRARAAGLKVLECPVPLIYKDYSRDFNGQFTGKDERLRRYLEVLDREAHRYGLSASFSPTNP